MGNFLTRLIKIASGSLVLFLPALSVTAQEIPNPIQARDFTQIITAIVNFAIKIAEPLSVIVILYAGALFMFAGGDVEKVKKAKRALLWALVGLGIILTGHGFVLIIKSILGVRGG